MRRLFILLLGILASTGYSSDPCARRDELEAHVPNPVTAEWLWRASQAWTWCGDGESTKEKRHAAYETALRYADGSRAADPTNRMAWIGIATAKGRLAEMAPPHQGARWAAEVRDACEKTIELSSGDTSTAALAHYVLAKTHFEAMQYPSLLRRMFGIGWAKQEEAESHFALAVQLDPASILYRFDYADALADWGKKDEARRQRTQALAQPERDPGDAERIAVLKERLLN